MKNCLLKTLPLCGMLFVGGCFSFQKASMEGLPSSHAGCASTNGMEKVEHALIVNYGWYLFNTFPLVSGDATPNARFPLRICTDSHVEEPVLMDRLTRYAKEKRCNVADMNIVRDENVFIEIYSIPLPIPYLLCYHELQLSATLVPQSRMVAGNPMNAEMGRLLDTIPDGGSK